MSILNDLVGQQSYKPFLDYCRDHIILDSGKKYDPLNRKCMEEIFEAYNSHPHITIEKGAQTGFSTLAIAHSLYMADVQGRTVIYYLPTDKMARDFGPTRFDPYINRSPYLKDRLSGTDQVGLKQIGTHFLYIRGLVSKTGAISIPADEIKFDEVALIDPENMELAQDRISASDLAWQKYFSVALFPEDGTDELYRASDMRKWFVRCGSCSRESSVEEDFPDNFEKKDGVVMLVCPKCGKGLDVENGHWVAEHPERVERRGYRVPQLIIPNLKLELIWSRWQVAKDKPSKLATFKRSVLSIPDSGNMQPISPEALRRVEEYSEYHFRDRSDEITGIGIDMGDKAHVVVAAPYGIDGMRCLTFFELDVEDLVELIQSLERPFNVGALVIDAMPYKTDSKRVVRALERATGYIQYFKGDELKEGVEGEDARAVNKVTVDRNESLDETTDLFAANPPAALLPQPRTPGEEEIYKTVKRHLLKLVKEEVEEGGEKRIRYKKNVPNHFGMAINSARIALYLAVGKRMQLGPMEYETVQRRRFTRKGAY